MNSQPDQEDVKFARSLVNPEKSVRDKTLATFRKHLGSQSSMEHMEMLKVWKALYYCMWLSDKAPIQAELAQSMCELTSAFATTQLSLLYIRMFFRIMLREWQYLDQYRVNKFYTLIRLMYRKALEIAHNAGWTSDLAEAILAIVDEEILTKKPNGIRFHLADIFLTELYTATNGRISTKDFMVVVKPFLDSLLRLGDNTVFIERVTKEVFGKFVSNFAAENANSSASEEEDAEVEKTLFAGVNTKALQKTVFDLASEESTPNPSRKRLYDLHKLLAARTGASFVSESLEELLVASTGKPAKQAMSAKKEKVSKKAAAAAAVVAAEVVPPTPAAAQSEKKAKKSKRSASELEEEAEVVPKTPSTKSSAKEAAAEGKKTTEKSAKKLKASKDNSSAEPAASSSESKTPAKEPKTPSASAKTAATTPAAAAAPVDADAPPPTFVASAKFAGRKPGYMFQKVCAAASYLSYSSALF